MHRSLHAFLAVCAFAAGTMAAGSAAAEWRLVSEVDAMTDALEKRAEVSSQGYRLAVYRGPEGRGFLLFSLGTTIGTIDSDRPLQFRVDKGQVHAWGGPDATLERLGLRFFFWEPGFVNIAVWHGEADQGLSKVLRDLLHGSTVVVRYPVGTGGTRDVTFTLRGSHEAIAEALDLPPSLTAPPEAHQLELERLAESYSDFCLGLAHSHGVQAVQNCSLRWGTCTAVLNRGGFSSVAEGRDCFDTAVSAYR